MKKILLIALMCAPMALYAQQLKFGHINAQDVLTSMPEYSIANGEIEAKAKEYQQEMQEMQAEFQRKAEDYDKTKDTMPQTKQEETEQELQDLYMKLQDANQDYQQKLQQLQQEKQQPLYTKLMNAITTVGKTGGYLYIMDIGSALYVNDAISEDVTAKVKAELKK
ncbi:MAG: OmpH family outer membrane protein [Prevotella sp.]|nr:OmpH family outer membrane protein [Prevotella sp.]